MTGRGGEMMVVGPRRSEWDGKDIHLGTRISRVPVPELRPQESHTTSVTRVHYVRMVRYRIWSHSKCSVNDSHYCQLSIGHGGGVEGHQMRQRFTEHLLSAVDCARCWGPGVVCGFRKLTHHNHSSHGQQQRAGVRWRQNVLED